MYFSEDYPGNIQLMSHRQVYGQKMVNNRYAVVSNCRKFVGTQAESCPTDYF